MVVGVLLSCLGCAATSPGTAAPVAATSDPAGGTTGPPPTYEVTASPGAAAGSQRHTARPTSVRLPSDVTVPVRVARTGDRGLLRVPSDIRAAGWWDGSARLGDAYGAIVVAGHVDSVAQGLGPFAELLSTRRGDQIVMESQAAQQTFVVSAVDLVPKSALNTHDDVFAASGRLRLVLITCAGPFDPSRGGYQNLAVVTARPTPVVQQR